jgi:hypothetical protein
VPFLQHSCLGSFRSLQVLQAPQEQRAFAEIFIKNRGNIRDVEKELGISYPTVRGRLEALIKALGYPVDSEPDVSLAQRAVQKKTIIERLSRGEISAQEAARQLKNLK